MVLTMPEADDATHRENCSIANRPAIGGHQVTLPGRPRAMPQTNPCRAARARVVGGTCGGRPVPSHRPPTTCHNRRRQRRPAAFRSHDRPDHTEKSTMTRRGRQRGLLPRIAAILVVALSLAAPAAHTGARQQDDEFGHSAQALIGEKLTSGEIDFETSLVYRTYALFDDPRLPADLAGGGSFGEDYPLFGQIKYTWNQLSPETQQVLTPFVVRPADSRSIYFKSLADGPRTVPES